MSPAIRHKPDTLIIHTGTNDITSDTDTQKFLDQAVNLLKTESPQTEIVISLPILRTDRGDQYAKKVHELKIRMKNTALRIASKYLTIATSQRRVLV